MVLNTERTLKVFKAFDDVNRIKIINLLSQEQMCACRILEELDVSQPTLSHHMKILCDSGIVNSHRSGKWTVYSLSQEGIENARNLLDCLQVVWIMQPICEVNWFLNYATGLQLTMWQNGCMKCHTAVSTARLFALCDMCR